MKILITGGLGFIGRHLVQLLADGGHQVLVYDNLSPQIHGAIPRIASWEAGTPITVVRSDILDSGPLREALQEVEAVAHLAAETGTGQSMYRIAHYNRVNVQGTAELLQLLAEERHAVRRLVLASSRAVYGEGAYRCPECAELRFPDPRGAEELERGRWDPACIRCGTPLLSVPTPEATHTRPASIYAATKVAQEELVRITCEALRLPAISLRFQNVYGEGQSLSNPYTGILSIFSNRLRQGLDLPLYEDGQESRDFVHVNDVAEALRLALESDMPSYAVYNVGSGTATSITHLVRELGRAYAIPVTTRITGQYRVGDIRHCCADLSRIGHDLGFAPRISLEAGLARFAAWTQRQPLSPDGLPAAEGELLNRGLMGRPRRCVTN